MTTWAQRVRHPWFNPPTMKRKLDDDASSSSEVSPATFSSSRRKRVRYSSLERTLAHMTLGSALATTSEDVDMWPKISPSRPREQETLDVLLPSSVEEPDTSEPVDMEVDPICKSYCFLIDPSFFRRSSECVVTDSTHDWKSIASGQLDIKEMQISSAVLECLRRQPKRPPIPLSCQPSQALVLYRAPKPLEQACDRQEGKPTRASRLVAHEDDVMEVE
jgi:hypothetical protein